MEFSNEIDAHEFHWLYTWFEYLLFKLCFLNFLFCTCNTSFVMNQDMFPHPFPVITPFDCSICPLVPIVTRLIVS